MRIRLFQTHLTLPITIQIRQKTGAVISYNDPEA